MSKDISNLINEAMQQLIEFNLSTGTMKAYRTRAFQPALNYYLLKGASIQEILWQEVNNDFKKMHEDGIISKSSLNWRLRGIKILLEIHKTGSFEWKVFSQKEKNSLSVFFENMLLDFSSELTCAERRKQNYCSIIRRLIIYMNDRNIQSLSKIAPVHVRDFMINISKDKPKSMDDVITALKRFFKYLNEKSYIDNTFWTILAAPRSRDHKVKPCMKSDETIMLIQQIDRNSNEGKRDFAILTLAATTGLRAGDISSLKLTDVDWKQNQLHLTQGKTQELLVLPLQKPVAAAVADYILHGRPESQTGYLFLRHCAPYTRLQDGVSISSIFRKYLLAAGIQHMIDDGKTFHGIRRELGTQMIATGVPVPTIAQVLGHKGIKATKQYISLDLDGLRNCVLSMDSIGGDHK
jgi:site-specific recombinase XerD